MCSLVDTLRRADVSVLAEDLLVVDADSSLWPAVRPLLDAALRLEQQDATYSWHGWSKQQIEAFLTSLPRHCTLLVGVWETSGDDDHVHTHEPLVLGCICEVFAGAIRSIRTFESLVDSTLPPVKELEPGFEHAHLLMNAAKAQITPVAWALFTDRITWDEWIFTEGDDGGMLDKSELLASLARQGRCVLLGSQVAHHQP